MKNNMVTSIDRGCVFLCGQIDISSEIIRNNENSEWINENLDEKEYSYLRSIYYESFINSLIPVYDNETHSNFYGETYHLIKNIDKQYTLCDQRFYHSKFIFDLQRVHIFGFPYNIFFLALEIEIPENTPLNDISLANSILRDINRYKELETTASEFIDQIQTLLKTLTGDMDAHYSKLLNTGNKFKVFQILKMDDISDEPLFELGTLSPVGCVSDTSNNYSPSLRYFKNIINNNSISVFNNWKALALVDTFTVIMKRDCNTTDIWKSYYFRLIYIHVLYQKSLLFVLNKRFRSNNDRKCGKQLLQDMKEQESRYAFSDISYNFLPQLIYKSMDKGLEVVSERNKLHNILEQEAERQEAMASYKLSRVLIFLTIITSLSVLYDTACLFKEILVINNIACYRIIVSACAVSIIAGILVLYKTSNKK